MKSLLPVVLVPFLLAACNDDAPPAQQAAPQKPAAAVPQPDPNSELAVRVSSVVNKLVVVKGS